MQSLYEVKQNYNAQEEDVRAINEPQANEAHHSQM